MMRVVVVANYEDFDETVDEQQRGPGNERRHATHAMLHHLIQQPTRRIINVDLLILDWKNPPKEAAKETQVAVCCGAAQKTAIWGSREQLTAKFSSSVWDVAICTHSRFCILDFAGQLQVKLRLAMIHDYNLPFGPWGQEQVTEQVKEHTSVFQKFELMCASEHLKEFVIKWGGRDVRAHHCNAADYDYFWIDPELFCPWQQQEKFVTLVSPCPEKGLPILLKLAQRMPAIQFLVIKTVYWTKPWHEQLLQELSNVTVHAASHKVDDFLHLTKLLLIPSVGQEAFSLIAVEAQRRGIPVVSSDVCGLPEANFDKSNVVADVQIVYDQRTSKLIMGMTMEEAESFLIPDRPRALTNPQSTPAVQENHQRTAGDDDVQDYMKVIQRILDRSEEECYQASQALQSACHSFVEKRKGRFMSKLIKMLEGHSSRPKLEPAVDVEALRKRVAEMRQAATQRQEELQAQKRKHGFWALSYLDKWQRSAAEFWGEQDPVHKELPDEDELGAAHVMADVQDAEVPAIHKPVEETAGECAQLSMSVAVEAERVVLANTGEPEKDSTVEAEVERLLKEAEEIVQANKERESEFRVHKEGINEQLRDFLRKQVTNVHTATAKSNGAVTIDKPVEETAREGAQLNSSIALETEHSVEAIEQYLESFDRMWRLEMEEQALRLMESTNDVQLGKNLESVTEQKPNRAKDPKPKAPAKGKKGAPPALDAVDAEGLPIEGGPFAEGEAPVGGTKRKHEKEKKDKQDKKAKKKEKKDKTKRKLGDSEGGNDDASEMGKEQQGEAQGKMEEQPLAADDEEADLFGDAPDDAEKEDKKDKKEKKEKKYKSGKKEKKQKKEKKDKKEKDGGEKDE